MTYQTIITVTDQGAKIWKLICQLPKPVSIEEVNQNQFNVFVRWRGPDGEILRYPAAHFSKRIVPAKGYRKVTSAYTSNEFGTPLAEGLFVTLALDLDDYYAGAIAQWDSVNHFINCEYRVTLLAPIGDLAGLVWDTCSGTLSPETNRWHHGRANKNCGHLQYGYYEPEKGSEEHPLIIWLHGAGEGGDDPRVAYMGNNVVNLSRETIQQYFGGAWILAPQAPSFWMDDGSGTYTRSSFSRYTKELKSLIDEFVQTHPIDKSRIYIGGCSNGGFMTIRMLVDYPGVFAAAFPMCEAFYDENLTDTQISSLAKESIWFLHARSDNIVDPEETSAATYRRLIKAGAKDIHMEYIYDYPPFPLVYHGCWIPGLQNQVTRDYDGGPVLVDGNATTLFQWLANHQTGSVIQRKHNGEKF